MCYLVHRGSTDYLSSLATNFLWCCLADQGSPTATQQIVSVESLSLLLHSINVIYVFSVMIH